MQFIDAASLRNTRRTGDGYLVADVLTARTGIQLYTGDEMGRPDLKVVRVYRPEDQVFNKDSLATYGNKPITDDHPSEDVTSKNWKDLAVGTVGGEVARDGEFVRIPLMITDQDTIEKIEDGKRELSAGYKCGIAWQSGKTPSGEDYDAIQKDIRINHVAVVDAGRAGSRCKIGDGEHWDLRPKSNPKHDRNLPVSDIKTQTVLFDGMSIEVTDQGAQALKKVQDANARLTADNEKLVADHAAIISAKDKELGEKDAEIEKLKDSQMTSEKLDQMVADRSTLVSSASMMVDGFKPDGLSNEEIRKQVVVAKFDAAAVENKSDDYIQARFDALVDALPKDKVQAALADQNRANAQSQNSNDVDEHAAYLNRMSDAWKPQELK